MTFIYKFNLDGAKLMWRHMCNKINGNDKLIAEYFAVSGQLMDAIRVAKTKHRKQKLRRAYRQLTESKMIPLGGNRFELAGYNAGMATRAQNQAKVVMAHAMLKEFGLSK
ncbi:MAG: hypothetical protein IJX89_05125 [Alphaproteobacteria bacterium]|nr:hypothetical protein [Alphaproteobacteria bacterium]